MTPRAKATSLGFEAALVDHLAREYFSGDSARLAERVEFTKQQVDSWRTGKRKPHRGTIRWLLSATIAPEFKVAAEFEPVNFDKKTHIRPVLKAALKSHTEKAGVYAFYDSMCNVLYVGKASTSFLTEMYQQLRCDLGLPFPKAVRKALAGRWQAVKFVSAYEVPEVEHLDYPRHVEALVLRLSKPIGNKVLGTLARSGRPKSIDEPG